MKEKQTALFDDATAINAYGVDHPADFLGPEVTSTSDPHIVVRVWDHLEQHKAALLALVKHPDKLDVVKGAHSPSELASIGNKIDADAKTNAAAFAGASSGGGTGWRILVDLKAGQEALATTYIQRWGDALTVSVDGTPYVPKGC
jgi:hypothetical protein